jgi:hypothetical protein
MSNEKNKIVIDKVTDLLSIPFTNLNSAKLSDFSGKYYEEIYNQALQIEKGEEYKETNDEQSISDDDYSLNDEENTNNEENTNDEPSYKMTYNENRYVTQNNNNVRKITFQMVYETIFGEEIGILGNLPVLGNWKKDDIFYLKWNEGNVWIGSIDYNDFSSKEGFEFKCVISFNRTVKNWESGDNNKIEFSKLYQDLIRSKRGKFNKFNYEYNDRSQELIIFCNWS